jgi:23S rRNA (pseudouridine1915-N3)-methyltransferase
MQIQIISVGQKMPDWVEIACDEYLRRMPRELPVNITSLNLAQRSSKSIETIKNQESKEILAKCIKPGFRLALDEKGKSWTSQQWAQNIDHWMMEYSAVNIIIGGPDGLADDCKSTCNQIISLGSMTMPHALVRVVIAEQLYRAWTILKGHPYHRI